MIFFLKSAYFRIWRFLKVKDPVMQAICTQLSNSQDWKEVKPKRNSNVFKIEWKPAYAAIALGGPIPLCFFHFDYADYSSAHDLVEKNEFET
ncbi:MAG: hypothetical protein KDC71_14350, partial [Acidobacteria bacterium]|nr:hypothetical protein [Acidobacteriota bacterium]